MRDELRWVCFRTYGVVALEVTGDEVVSVDVFAYRYCLSRKTDDLVEFTNRIAGGDGMDGKFVACGNVGDGRNVEAGEALARRNWLECDRDVV